MNNSEETTKITNKTILRAIEGLSGNFDRLETKVDGLKSKVGDLVSRVGNLETKVDALESKVDGLEAKIKSHDAQFEAIRRGMVANSAAFDRLESLVYSVRSDMSGLKAHIKELTERVMGVTKESLELS